MVISSSEQGVAFLEQKLQKESLLFVAQFQQLIHIVPSWRELIEGVIPFQTVDHGARLVAFQLVVRILTIVVENLAALVGVEIHHEEVWITGADAYAADIHGALVFWFGRIQDGFKLFFGGQTRARSYCWLAS